MEFNIFLQKAQDLPVVNTRVLSAGRVDSLSFKVQISRWVKAGKLIQLKRGIYLLAEPYRKIPVSEFYVAGVLKNPSYISLEKALEYHGLIPEAVSVFTSVTTKRPEMMKTPVGRYEYRHIKPSLFWGYTSLTTGGQTFFMATPEKALLDLFYLNHIDVSPDYLKEMRLQNVENIGLDKLLEYARRFKKKTLLRMARLLERYVKEERKGVKDL
ncbi:MAG TPA: hypothetical protein VI749_03355 [Candidatus Omnitrophota bacterium]|nr:hypothetical protein [Candidatus Omnitrophota bacterium]